MASAAQVGGNTWPAIVVSYGPTTMRSGDTLRAWGWMLTPVAEMLIRVGPTLTACMCELTRSSVSHRRLLICTHLRQHAPQYYTAPR